jgi:hypothetical protein
LDLISGGSAINKIKSSVNWSKETQCDEGGTDVVKNKNVKKYFSKTSGKGNK